MDLWTLIFAFLAVFLQLKVLEYKDDPSGVHVFMSIAAWVSAVIAVVFAVIS